MKRSTSRIHIESRAVEKTNELFDVMSSTYLNNQLMSRHHTVNQAHRGAACFVWDGNLEIGGERQ